MEMRLRSPTLSYLLHPPLLDETGLQSALRWYAEGFAQRSGFQVNLEISPDDFHRLPHDLEIAIFRVVQESLTNIHRHSGSTTAVIRLAQDLNNLEVEISDTGIGVPAGRSEGKFIPGVGIMGMRERMRQFGGSFDVVASDKGTIIRATIPLQDSVPKAV
jgi:signal transduction histidine kinase